jgi:hypothetical protein
MRPCGREHKPGAGDQRQQQEEDEQKATQEQSDPFADQSKHIRL